MIPPIEPTLGRVILYTYRLDSHSFAMKEDVYNTAPADVAGVKDGVMCIFIKCPYTRAVIVHTVEVSKYGYGPGEWHYPPRVESKQPKGLNGNGR